MLGLAVANTDKHLDHIEQRGAVDDGLESRGEVVVLHHGCDPFQWVKLYSPNMAPTDEGVNMGLRFNFYRGEGPVDNSVSNADWFLGLVGCGLLCYYAGKPQDVDLAIFSVDFTDFLLSKKSESPKNRCRAKARSAFFS